MDSNHIITLFFIFLFSTIPGVQGISDSQKTILFGVMGVVGGLILTVAVLLIICCYMQNKNLTDIAFKEQAPKCHKKTKVQTIKSCGGIDNTRFDIQAAAMAQYYNRPIQYPASSFYLQPYDVMDTMVLPGFENPARKPRSKKTRPKTSIKIREIVDTKELQDNSTSQKTLERPVLPAVTAPGPKILETDTPVNTSQKRSQATVDNNTIKEQSDSRNVQSNTNGTQLDIRPSLDDSAALLSSKLKSEKIFGLDQPLRQRQVEEEEERIQPKVMEFGSMNKNNDEDQYDDDTDFFFN